VTSPREPTNAADGRIIGVDIGGTFTDVVAIDPETGELITAKTPTTPGRLEAGVGTGLRELGEGAGVALGEVRHGTTVVTNALLEGRVAKTALLCTKGFRDVLDTRRLWRERLFGYDWERPLSLVPRSMRFEVGERIDAHGEVLTALDPAEVLEHARRIRDLGVEAVAIAYLFSFRNPVHERETARILAKELPDIPISLSSDVLPEVHEYERTSTTVINAQVRPRVSRYLADLGDTLGAVGAPGPLRIVRSDGSLISSSVAAEMPVRLVHSGPAVGVTGAARLAGWLGWQNVVTLDMGGTSTDVSLIWNGEPLRTFEYDIDWNIPVRATQIDIQSIGAGGGSIVGSGPGERLFVGPRSAGAEPGPACYGRGGEEATVTDALLVLGVLPDQLLGGELSLDRSAAEAALRRALPTFADPCEAAAAVYTLTLHKMAVLTREVTINRGYDPRECVLVCFGGAGGLFAVDLARELSMPSVYVPPAASLFSAVGAALSRVSYEAIDGMFIHLEDLGLKRLHQAAGALADRVRQSLVADRLEVAEVLIEADMKYRAQPETLTVPLEFRGSRDPLPQAVTLFHDEHEKRFGLRREGEPIDLVTLRAIGMGPSTESWTLSPPRPVAGLAFQVAEPRQWFRGGAPLRDVPVVALEDVRRVEGPAFIEDAYTTLAVPPGSTAERDRLGGILLEASR
jgi:N-methylhydantoinase A/oxoprolinase/acetone carboxylase beta subunit